jgi:hypothetical protein
VGGVALIFLTWIITLAYMRRSDRVWGPLEARVREEAERSAPTERGAASQEPQEVSR